MRPVPSGFRLTAVALMLWMGTATVAAARLYPETLAAWAEYVAATESRIRREWRSPEGFLAMDFLGDAAERRDVLAGAIVVERMASFDAQGHRVTAPGGLIHHFRGGVFIPGVTVRQLLADLMERVPQQEDILRSAILERGPDRTRIYLKLQRRRLVTVTYNTEHSVTFSHMGDTRAASTSVATRIAELTDAETPEERELPPGNDRGFLWRLNSYWRYEEVPGGVIAECESLSLSRDVPSFLRYLVSPLVESTARESMERTLLTLRSRFAN